MYTLLKRYKSVESDHSTDTFGRTNSYHRLVSKVWSDFDRDLGRERARMHLIRMGEDYSVVGAKEEDRLLVVVGQACLKWDKKEPSYWSEWTDLKIGANCRWSGGCAWWRRASCSWASLPGTDRRPWWSGVGTLAALFPSCQPDK